MRGGQRVGEVMIRLGYITADELSAALVRQQQQMEQPTVSTLGAGTDAAA